MSGPVWVLKPFLEHVRVECDGAVLDDVVAKRQRQRRQAG
jgi:hypothetical protein